MHSALATITAFVALLQYGSAIPTGTSSCTRSNQLATFDDIPVIPAVVANPIPIPYKGLQYQGFNVANGVQPGSATPGLVPHSAPNVAISNTVSQTTAGTAMLTTNYQGGSADVTFDLKSFYYGCVVASQNSAVVTPVQCTISIAGYTGNDNTVSSSNQVCAQSFQYNPTTMTGSQNLAFTGAINSACKNLKFVQVAYTLPGGLSLANSNLGISIDDVSYSLNKGSC